jgi:3-oxoacyl-[acyl-carrier-protein] synthase III
MQLLLPPTGGDENLCRLAKFSGSCAKQRRDPEADQLVAGETIVVKIAAISYRVPSRVMTNSDMIEMVDELNPNVSRPRKAVYFRAVDTLYRRLGAKTRHVRDIARGEKASDMILGAMDEALARASMAPEDIDLLIYCGVGRGFLEPANAYFYAKARSMGTTNCFDITDACMSWVRAIQIAYQMLRTGAFRNVMVINGEFHLGIHDRWRIETLESLAYSFPMFTIGEAATATILLPGGQDWRFDYASQTDYADLCTIPLPEYSQFVAPSNRIGLNGANKFVSFGRELFEAAEQLIGPLITRTVSDIQAKRWYFPHAPSRTHYETLLPKYGVPAERIFLEVFPRFGNVVSASVPVGLCLAEEQGVLARGDQIAFVPVSAGMVASVVQAVF